MKLYDPVSIDKDLFLLCDFRDEAYKDGVAPIHVILQKIIEATSSDSFTSLFSSDLSPFVFKQENRENKGFINEFLSLYTKMKKEKSIQCLGDVYLKFLEYLSESFTYYLEKLDDKEQDLFLLGVVIVWKNSRLNIAKIFENYCSNKELESHKFFKELTGMNMEKFIPRTSSQVLAKDVNNLSVCASASKNIKFLFQCKPVFFKDLSFNYELFWKDFGLRYLDNFKVFLTLHKLIAKEGFCLPPSIDESEFIYCGVKDFLDSFYDKSKKMVSYQNLYIGYKFAKENKNNNKKLEEVYDWFLEIADNIFKDDINSCIQKKIDVLNLVAYIKPSFHKYIKINNSYLKELVSVKNGVIEININALTLLYGIKSIASDVAKLYGQQKLPTLRVQYEDVAYFKKIEACMTNLEKSFDSALKNECEEFLFSNVKEVVLNGGVSHPLNALLDYGCTDIDKVKLIKKDYEGKCSAYFLQVSTNLTNLDSSIRDLVMNLILEKSEKLKDEEIENVKNGFHNEIISLEMEAMKMDIKQKPLYKRDGAKKF